MFRVAVGQGSSIRVSFRLIISVHCIACRALRMRDLVLWHDLRKNAFQLTVFYQSNAIDIEVGGKELHNETVIKRTILFYSLSFICCLFQCDPWLPSDSAIDPLKMQARLPKLHKTLERAILVIHPFTLLNFQSV